MTPTPLNHSPFFRLQAKKKLATLLNSSVKEIKDILQTLDFNPNEYYHVFMLYQHGKGRQVEEPIKNLKRLHGRIKNLLARTETPKWLISGQKGKSIVDNARPHINAKFVTCMDIEKFYKNVEWDRVFQMFLYTFYTSPDVAYWLTNLIMYYDPKTKRYFIPTGSPCSQIVAFWAYYQTFNNIAMYAENLGLTMTLYVDDLTLSFNKTISKCIISNINKRLKSVGLSLKLSKIKQYGPFHYKVVTGNCITPDHKLVPTRKLRYDINKMVSNKKLTSLTIHQLRTLNGKIAATHLQDPTTFACLYAKTKKILRAKISSSTKLGKQ